MDTLRREDTLGLNAHKILKELKDLIEIFQESATSFGSCRLLENYLDRIDRSLSSIRESILKEMPTQEEFDRFKNVRFLGWGEFAKRLKQQDLLKEYPRDFLFDLDLMEKNDLITQVSWRQVKYTSKLLQKCEKAEQNTVSTENVET